MKRIIRGILAASVAVSAVFGAAACDTVKNGSVIKNCTVTLGYTENGEYKTQDVVFELYKNFAPATIEHFTYLVQNGYYENTIVSNLNGYVEFGEYYRANGALKSKYDADAEKGYYGIITDEYAAGKKMINGEKRYFTGNTVYGEFADNGIGGNKLDFTGALALKRDYSESASKSYYNTARATMAITFSSSTYFNSKTKFAIIGKLSKSDEITVTGSDGKDETITSYDFVYRLYNNYKTDKDDDETYSDTYYYFTFDYSAYPYNSSDADYSAEDEENYAKLAAKLSEYGRNFKKDKDGVYYYKSGDAYKALDTEDEDDALLIKAFSDKSLYNSILPYKDIVIEKIVIEK